VLRASTARFLLVTVLSGLLAVTALPATAQTTSDPPAPCPNRELPPPPVDTSEEPAPGEPSPEPPPVPDTPAGGGRMAECGLILPAGVPDPPQPTTAHAWLLQDLDTGEVLAAKDPHGRHRPASLIKTLLALVVIDELSPEAGVVATREDAHQECTCVGIVAGVEYSVHDLVHALLMRSGNDVAHTLASALGGVDVAVRKMNALAGRLGAADTHAATPSGLDGPGMMTSAYDMSLIFGHALREPRYADAVGTRRMSFPGPPGKPDLTVINDNKLWGSYPGFIGGKTGFTDDARHTYAGAAERDGRRLAVVLLRAEQHPIRVAAQAARLLDYGFELAASAQPVGSVAVAPRTAQAGAEQDQQAAAAATTPRHDDPFGTTGWIITLVVTVLVIGGLILAHRRGLLVRPE
jgi:D-alanyl-D-alanine carboxypeptidase (penicillin-binding protein 5/6)